MDDFAKYEARTSNAPTLGRGWASMSSAPRDGRLIEIECRYGVKPWRALAKCGSIALLGDGGAEPPSWLCYPDFSGGPFALGTVWWRPFNGDPETYWSPYDGIDDYAYYCGARPLYDGPTRPASPTVGLLRGLWRALGFGERLAQ